MGARNGRGRSAVSDSLPATALRYEAQFVALVARRKRRMHGEVTFLAIMQTLSEVFSSSPAARRPLKVLVPVSQKPHLPDLAISPDPARNGFSGAISGCFWRETASTVRYETISGRF